MAYKQRIGQIGEELAANYLRKQGSEVIDRNWRIRGGEIDLIARDPDGTILFVEVKSRSSLAHGHPLEAITPTKALRLQRLALAWLSTHGLWGAPFRIDCCGIFRTPHGEWEYDYRAGVL